MNEQKKYSNKVISIIILIFGIFGLISAIQQSGNDSTVAIGTGATGEIGALFSQSSNEMIVKILEIVSSLAFALTGVLGIVFLKDKSKYGICKIVNIFSILLTLVAAVMLIIQVQGISISADLINSTKISKEIIQVIMYSIIIVPAVVKLIFNLLYFRGINKNENNI